MIHFLQPEWFWLLTLLPLALLWRGRRGAVAAVQYSNVSLARQVARQTRSRAGHWVWLLPVLAGALMVVGLARPQFSHGSADVQASGINIMLALDVSGSMQALDFKVNDQPVNRIEVVKSVVSKFIDARPNDRIGIVAFAGLPYLVSPLTLDHDWLQQNLGRVQVAGVEDGTAIGSAIADCVNRLRDTPAKSKIIVLLTDGMNNSGKISPAADAEAATAMGVKVYTIAAGGRGDAPVPVKDDQGNTQIVMAKVDVDEATLQKIAAETGGQFYRATDTDSLKNIYANINGLEKSKETVHHYDHYQDLYALAVIPALLVLGLGVGLEQTRYRRLP